MNKSSVKLNGSSSNARSHGEHQKRSEFEEEKEFLFSESGDAIFVVHSVSGEIVEANATAAEMAGYPASKLRGMNVDRLISEDEISSKTTESPALEINGQSKATLRRQDGACFSVDLSTFAFRRGDETLNLIFVRLPMQDETSQLKSPQHVFAHEISTAAKDDPEPAYEFPNIIGKSEKIRRICQLIGQVAKTDCTVLIQGESGTGKEIVAHAIHYHSPRSKAPFVKVNCAALSETILESELFGHTKGAFTGAIRDHRGRFMQADGGTLLLDEINSMSLSGQAKFLRVLQEGEFEPVGSSVTITADVRVVVGSNTNLERAVAEGDFREDLYYRLNVFPIFIPPLRERKEDIPLLAHHFLRKYNLVVGKAIQDLTSETLARMMEYDWPGNVRELRNAIEHAVIVGKGPVIFPCDLPSNLAMSGTVKENGHSSTDLGLRDRLNLLEKQIVLDALTRSNGVKKQAAALLQIDPRNFPYLLRKHNLF